MTLVYPAAIPGPTSSGQPVLPVEIQDIIIDYVTAGDKFALQALSLTSRQFRALAQPRSLKNISLKIKASPLLGLPASTSPWRFLDLLDVSPHLAFYVRSISILQPADGLAEPSLASQVAETMAMAEIMSQTANLRSLWFPLKDGHRQQPVDYTSEWKYMERGLQDLLVKFHRQEVSYPRQVDLRALVTVPGAILSSLSNVRNLHIAPLCIPDLNDITDTQTDCAQIPNVLDTLELCFNEDWCTWGPTLQFLSSPKSGFDLTRLNTLVTSVFLTVDQLESIISLCADTLQHLVLRLGSDVHQLVHSFLYYKGHEDRRNNTRTPDFSNLQRLESLTLHGTLFNLAFFPGRYSTPAPWIGRLLASLTKSPAFSNTFRSLHTELDLEGVKPRGFACLNWEPVVRVLADNFPKSRMCAIIFKFWIMEGGENSIRPTSLPRWKLKKINNDQLRDLQRTTGIVSIC